MNLELENPVETVIETEYKKYTFNLFSKA